MLRRIGAHTQTIFAGNKFRAINTAHKVTVVSLSESNLPAEDTELQQLQSLLDTAAEEVQAFTPEASEHFLDHLHGEVACIIERDKQYSKTSLHGDIGKKRTLVESQDYLKSEFPQGERMHAVGNLAKMVADELRKSKRA